MKKVISSERIPIKMWLDDIEENALEQAKNVANLPFTYKHIAIMSDAHAGIGCSIGTVCATKGVVLPALVGVDISCFTGDTKIPLLDGTQSSLKELEEKGKDVYVYSLDEEGNVKVGKATPIKTRDRSNLLEITISGGCTIKCTPDHKFMLLDGSYKEAIDLKVFDSLMPFYRSYQSRDGYERVYALKGKGVMTHVMVAEQFIGPRVDNNIIHHKDDCWFNNHPDNLEYMQPSLHSSHHGRKKAATTHFKTEEFKLKRLQVLNEKGFYAPEFSKKKKQVAAKNMATYMDNNYEEWKDKIKDNGERGKEYLVKYNQSEKGRQKSKEVANRIYTCDVCGEEIRSPIAFYNHKKKLHKSKSNNHKVLKIVNLTEQETTYCLNVEDYHNFALSVGVFVHNCGLIAQKTNKLVGDINISLLKNIIGGIRQVVPFGLNKKHKVPVSNNLMPPIVHPDKTPIVVKEYEKARYSLGTGGAGNHFCELQQDPEGYLWVMIHSGSRNLGLTVANHYIKLAKALNEKYYSKVDPKLDLAFLPLDTTEAILYLNEMNYCVEFALANRNLMMYNIRTVLSEMFPGISYEDPININHNYARMENHGENVLVHRKGATSAREGEIGIIPGSLGTKSYIVKGKGNPASFNSVSHGAGRTMGRKEAIRKLDLQSEIKMLDDQGIVHGIRNQADLDEAVGSYKDITVVMKNQEDLVDIVTELTPVASLKG